MTRNNRSRTLATARSARSRISQAIVTVELMIRQSTSAESRRLCSTPDHGMVAGVAHTANSRSRRVLLRSSVGEDYSNVALDRSPSWPGRPPRLRPIRAGRAARRACSP